VQDPGVRDVRFGNGVDLGSQGGITGA